MPNHDHGVGKLLKCNLVCSIHVLDHLILSIPHLAVRENLCVLIFHNLLQVAKSYDVVVIDVWIYQVVNNFGVKLSMILDRHNIPTRVCSLKFGDFPVINFFLCSTQRQRTSLVRTNKWNYRMNFFFCIHWHFYMPQLAVFWEFNFIIILCANLKIILTIRWFTCCDRPISEVKLFHLISRCLISRVLSPLICLIHCTFVQTCHMLYFTRRVHVSKCQLNLHKVKLHMSICRLKWE